MLQGELLRQKRMRQFGQTKKASVVGTQVMWGNEKQRWKGGRSGKTLWDGNISEFYPKYNEMVMIFLLFIFFLPEDRRMAPPPGICVGERSEIWQEMRKESINKVFFNTVINFPKIMETHGLKRGVCACPHTCVCVCVCCRNESPPDRCRHFWEIQGTE